MTLKESVYIALFKLDPEDAQSPYEDEYLPEAERLADAYMDKRNLKDKILYTWEDSFERTLGSEELELIYCVVAKAICDWVRERNNLDGCTLAKQAKEDAMCDETSDLKDLEQ